MNKELIKAEKEKPCNHFMVWNIQGGYSYYRCSSCNYIDGEKTFQAQNQDLLKKIERDFIREFCNDHNGKLRWLRGVALDMPDLLEQILEFFDKQLLKEI